MTKDAIVDNSAEKDTQKETWIGKFGDEYVDRNDYEELTIEPGTKGFGRILAGVEIESVLEVGSNIGLNLVFINKLLKEKVKTFAVEPNKKAYDKLTANKDITGLHKAWNWDAFQLPLDDASIDLVFTSGVLIHIDPKNLGRATDEIVRVSRKHVLCMEYFSPTPEEKRYRGHEGLLFKRDFGAFYLDRFTFLKCIGYGFLWKRELPIFDNVNWWLFEK